MQKLAELEARLKSVPGKLPVAKAWQPETVVYQAEMISHNGSLWQAKRDTAQRPGGEDWILIARHGRDAITPTVRGLFDTHEAYAQLDVFEFEGASYIAQRESSRHPRPRRWMASVRPRAHGPPRGGQGRHRGRAAVGRCEACRTGAGVE
jgi:hypothetical protein